MTKRVKIAVLITLCIFVCTDRSSDASPLPTGQVLAGWYDFATGAAANNEWDIPTGPRKAADISAPGVAAELVNGDGNRSAWTSTDGTFGASFPTPAADMNGQPSGTPNGAMSIKTGTDGGGDLNNSISFFITNNTGADLILESLVFDVGRRFINGQGQTPAENLQLEYVEGDLAIPDNTFLPLSTLAGALLGVTNADVGDYDDFAFSLLEASTLSDNVLGNGEMAHYKLYVQGAECPGCPYGIDNIAFIGVPEPTGLGLLWLGSLILMRRRTWR